MTILKVVGWLIIIAVIFFVVTFTVYIFNLDMKAAAFMTPKLEKIYDRRKREKRL